jgi:hypothetical protein
MPVKQCTNGKWRVGTGECIYDTKEKAIEVWQAILASGKFAESKISYDYDETLNTDKGMEMAKKDIDSGKTVYIISARNDKSGMMKKANELGIPNSRVYATGSNKAKIEKIKQLGIGIHYDNNPDVINEVNALPKTKGVKFQFQDTYNDYPEAATNNAKRALKWADENGWGSCGEATGKARANQLANREPISRDTISRMASFKRHQQYKDVPYSDGCGGLMWDAWGGDAGIEWASRKLEQIDRK